ncbi:hypothetical protein [Micromonospora echinofusca]|uniref:Uncharacterized protein n=1 Tax=Micromonospora echinofusca TaxID=47858 RepID=A0ABS3VJC0_MICEH|nr:hypothetical protein [Micromonospora echinofusca]MBO4204624.1 hypothetical protein [Micromonospora echinofusca]
MFRSTTGRRARRSTLALLTGTAVAALLSVSSAGAAPVQDRSEVGVSARTDVYIKDVSADLGYQPHSYDPLWKSPDIKVCPTAIECAVSQNPRVGVTNYIFVKLRNPGPYGTGTDNGTLRVYRTTPGGGANWPGAWTQIGAVSVPVFAGVTTVTIPWNGVPGPGHFCLLARWVSPTDPFTFEGPSISTNVRHNNNIAWRNVDSVYVLVGGPIVWRPFAIGNPLTTAARSSVTFRQTGTGFQNAGGRLVVDLGPTLTERWLAGGAVGKGIRQVGQTQFEVLDPATASIDNLLLNGGERVEFGLNFTAAALTTEKASIDVIQVGPDVTGEERADLGGVQYDITVGRQ